MENKFAIVGRHRIRYIESGTGTPIIMIAGLGFDSSADQWKSLLPFLTDFHCIAFDQVGWGLSDRPPDGYSFPLLTESAAGFIEALGLSEVIVMGHTLGGWIAALLAEQRPDLVSKLVLVNTAGLNPTPPRAAGSFTLPTKEQTRTGIERTFGDSIEVTEAMVDEEFSRNELPNAEDSFNAILRFINDIPTRQQWSLASRLPGITCPTLVVWGAEDPVIGLQYGRQAVELLPNGSIALIEGGTHSPYSRKPAEFAAAFREFALADR